MKHIQATVLSLILSFGLALPTAHAAGDAAAGQIKFNTCAGCHGIPGYSNIYPTYAVPKLGGQHPEYIVASLKAYRSGERAHKTMSKQASSLSDEDIADIAAYLGSLSK